MKYASKALNSIVDTVDEPNTYQKAYTIVDAATGVRNVRNNWGMELYIQNLTDERAQLHINRQDFLKELQQTVLVQLVLESHTISKSATKVIKKRRLCSPFFIE